MLLLDFAFHLDTVPTSRIQIQNAMLSIEPSPPSGKWEWNNFIPIPFCILPIPASQPSNQSHQSQCRTGELKQNASWWKLFVVVDDGSRSYSETAPYRPERIATAKSKSTGKIMQIFVQKV